MLDKVEDESLRLAPVDPEPSAPSVPTFTYVKARSVPRQEKPYPRLDEVIKQEVVFEFHDTQGTMAGFRFPTYMADLNVRGYHFHFLNTERTAGGHVYDCRVHKVTVAIDDITEFLMSLPGHGDFPCGDLSVTTAKRKHAGAGVASRHSPRFRVC